MKWIEAHYDWKSTECLVWPFNRKPNGYGQIKIKGTCYVVNRLMCEYRHGPPPTPKHEAAHECGKGHLGCVNPCHLTWKTRIENQADRIVHGTTLRGERSGTAKLTPSQVREVRKELNTSNSVLANRFGVNRESIRQVKLGNTWWEVANV